MTSGISTVSSVSGVITPPVTAAPAKAAVSNTTPAAPSEVPVTPLHNPVVVQDPSAGFITEYLSANGGQILAQTPSAITVAYLRFGLAADGTKKPPTTSVSQTA